MGHQPVMKHHIAGAQHLRAAGPAGNPAVSKMGGTKGKRAWLIFALARKLGMGFAKPSPTQVGGKVDEPGVWGLVRIDESIYKRP